MLIFATVADGVNFKSKKPIYCGVQRFLGRKGFLKFSILLIYYHSVFFCFCILIINECCITTQLPSLFPPVF